MSCRDGAPYCEKDYQGLFGVKCEACHQFITGKVLEVSDRRTSLKAPVIFLKALENTRGSLFPFFSIFFSHVEERVVVDDESLRDLLCGAVFSGSAY